jgi:phenylalanyl-tRNA synthetase alpha chain
MRWVPAYFPFTNPSFELEIYFQEEWLEVLGCGIIQPEIVRNSDRGGAEIGWAFGLGLERLAMVLFDIPDIRLFWTDDDRFHKQFTSGKIVRFLPFSKYPPCYKDVTFWVPEDFHPNDLNEVVRDVAGDLVEQVELVDEFTHPKTQKLSNCFRITYRSMERSLTNEEIDELQFLVREKVVNKFGAELR